MAEQDSSPERSPVSITVFLGIADALALAKPVVEAGCNLINSVLGKPCKVAGELLADQIYAFQWHNRVRIFAKAQALLDEHDVPAAVLPTGFLMPLLDAAGNIEADDLQNLWAQLLASAVQHPSARHPMFVDALRQMSSEDALLFHAICTKVVDPDDMAPPFPLLGSSLSWRPDPGQSDLIPTIYRLEALRLVSVTGTVHYGDDPGGPLPTGAVTGFGLRCGGNLSG
ncbi:MAG: DUF4393 domain-containing protein [Candidatus Eisenbacteria bacterium]|nr:DUF4393 domain-containing protein [Candidatus Eisenbacteria bacterium]